MGRSLQNTLLGLIMRVGSRNAPFTSPEQLRASLLAPPDALSQPDPPSKLRRTHVVFEYATPDATNGPWPVYRIEPRTSQPRATVVFLHGGAHIRQANRLHWKLVAELVDKAHVRVVFPRFPVAPDATAEGTIPAILDLVSSVIADYADEGPVRLMGDSAGGGIALAVACGLRDQGRRSPDGILLIAPWLDVTMTDPSQLSIAAKDPILAIPGLAEAGRLWAGELAPSDSLVSPLNADFHGLPPIVVMCGTYDLLVADARRFVQSATAAEVPITYIEEPGLFHDYPLLPTPEGAAARAKIASWAGRH